MQDRHEMGFAFEDLERDELRRMEHTMDAVDDMIASLFGLEVTLDAAAEDTGNGA